MNNINLTGTYTLYELNLTDPTVAVNSIRYDYESGNATINIKMFSVVGKYSHVRDLPPKSFTDYLTDQDVSDYISDILTGRLTTPPESNGYAIVIPDEFQWAFPVKISGYEIPMFEHNGQQVVEASYLMWKVIYDEFDKPANSDYKERMWPIFIYAKTNPTIIEL